MVILYKIIIIVLFYHLFIYSETRFYNSQLLPERFENYKNVFRKLSSSYIDFNVENDFLNKC